MRKTFAIPALVGGLLLSSCATDVEVVSGQASPPTTTECRRIEGVGDCLGSDPGMYSRGAVIVDDTSAQAMSLQPSGAILTDEQIAAMDALPLATVAEPTTTIAPTTTTVAPSALYRARNGDTARGELVARIYLERNVALAGSQLGFTDYDPDGDGWALVARTNGDGDNGPLAKFWLVSGSPRVSTRHPQKGCLELTPQSLGEVRKGQTRFMTEVAQNTANCRTQPPEADTDNNGIPDNVQPLHRARNGDATKGEVATRVYFERNLAASEATIGISDYDPDTDGWAPVGRSNGASDDGVVGSLTMNGPTPFVTVTKSNGTCLKLTPASLALVARGQTRFLTSSLC
jgi:hypothetical protein